MKKRERKNEKKNKKKRETNGAWAMEEPQL